VRRELLQRKEFKYYLSTFSTFFQNFKVQNLINSNFCKEKGQAKKYFLLSSRFKKARESKVFLLDEFSQMLQMPILSIAFKNFDTTPI